jgi:hypothetical protein
MPTDWVCTLWYSLPSTVSAPGGKITANPMENPKKAMAYKDGALRSTREWSNASGSFCMLKYLSKSATLTGFKRTIRHKC